MDDKKKTRLKAAGFTFTTVSEFLELTPKEEALVEIKVALSALLREARRAKG